MESNSVVKTLPLSIWQSDPYSILANHPVMQFPMIDASVTSIPSNPQVFHSLIYSSFDATALELYIKSRSNQIKLESSDMISPESIDWVIENKKYNAFSDLLRLSDYSRLKRIVIGEKCFQDNHSFELNNLPSLQSIVISKDSFFFVPLFSLTSTIHWVSSFTDLPELQSVKLDNYAFRYVHSVVFESDWMNGLMIQICQNYNPFNFNGMLLKVIVVMIERQLRMNPTTSRTHWQWKVRLNEMMNE